jgi:hypothetical protein
MVKAKVDIFKNIIVEGIFYFQNLNSHTLRLNGLAISILMTITMFFYSWKSQLLTDAVSSSFGCCQLSSDGQISG